MGIAAVVAACAWNGCTVTRANYRTLSFFFDGVPDPDAPGPGGGSGDATIAVEVVVHQPFAEENCEACHKEQYRPTRNDPTSCLSCHSEKLPQHAWTHGAVAGGACLWCHAPHESARKWLLRGPDRKICVQCHAATTMNADRVPAHADAAASCLACHFGHGGNDSLMLRPGATAQAPPAEGQAPETTPITTPKTTPSAPPFEASPRALPAAPPETSPAGPGTGAPPSQPATADPAPPAPPALPALPASPASPASPAAGAPAPLPPASDRPR